MCCSTNTYNQIQGLGMVKKHVSVKSLKMKGLATVRIYINNLRGRIGLVITNLVVKYDVNWFWNVQNWHDSSWRSDNVCMCAFVDVLLLVVCVLWCCWCIKFLILSASVNITTGMYIRICGWKCAVCDWKDPMLSVS